jgi:hypothetical protein
LKEKAAAPIYKTEMKGLGEPPHCPHDTLVPQKLALKFADMWQSLIRYNSLSD